METNGRQLELAYDVPESDSSYHSFEVPLRNGRSFQVTVESLAAIRSQPPEYARAVALNALSIFHGRFIENCDRNLAAELLGCSLEHIDELTKQGILDPKLEAWPTVDILTYALNPLALQFVE